MKQVGCYTETNKITQICEASKPFLIPWQENALRGHPGENPKIALKKCLTKDSVYRKQTISGYLIT